MYSALNDMGFEVVHQAQHGWREGDYLPCDFAVIYGMRTNGKEIIAQHNKHGAQVIVCDLGYIDRAQKQNDYDGYWQIGLNGLNWIPDTAPDDRFIWEYPEHKKGGDYVLIAEQVPHDASHGMGVSELRAWTRSKIKECEALGLDYIVRPHPHNGYSEFDKRTTTIEQDIENALCVVVHNSNTGNDALMAGKPVCCDENTRYKPTYYEVASKQITDQFPDCRDYLNRLSYGQWKRQEIVNGKAFEYVISKM